MRPLWRGEADWLRETNFPGPPPTILRAGGRDRGPVLSTSLGPSQFRFRPRRGRPGSSRATEVGRPRTGVYPISGRRYGGECDRRVEQSRRAVGEQTMLAIGVLRAHSSVREGWHLESAWRRKSTPHQSQDIREDTESIRSKRRDPIRLAHRVSSGLSCKLDTRFASGYVGSCGLGWERQNPRLAPNCASDFGGCHRPPFSKDFQLGRVPYRSAWKTRRGLESIRPENQPRSDNLGERFSVKWTIRVLPQEGFFHFGDGPFEGTLSTRSVRV